MKGWRMSEDSETSILGIWEGGSVGRGKLNMPWKTGEARLRISRCIRNSFPSDERKMVSASGASKLYGAMSEVLEVGLRKLWRVICTGPRCCMQPQKVPTIATLHVPLNSLQVNTLGSQEVPITASLRAEYRFRGIHYIARHNPKFSATSPGV